VDDADHLWTVRGENGRVLDERIGPRVREDVAVPLAKLDALVAALRRIGRTEGVRLHLFGHLGEGSLHPNYAVDPGSLAADRIRRAVYTASLSLGGTISAEHGVGQLKRSFLERELGGPAVRMLRAVRSACDPDGILNPGKLYPEDPSTIERSSPSPWGGGVRRARRALPSVVPRRGAGPRAKPRRHAAVR
jgi:FAD/FMN-containing dehydrogenase